jgi:Uma2 family endonuclease
MDRPDELRWELVQGEPIAMAPERAAHARAKLRIAARLDAAVREAGLACEVFGDGMAVQVDEATVYEPDVLLRCGAPLPDDAIKVTDPLIVVEVISPSSRSRDTGAKLADYFRIPSLRHYVIVRTHDRTLIHHSRIESGEIMTRIIHDGRIDFAGMLVLDEIFPVP